MDNTILNYSRWIIFHNCVVKYNVGDNTHMGWFVDNYGYWRSTIFSTQDVREGISKNYTVLGDTNEQYSLSYLRNFVHSAFR